MKKYIAMPLCLLTVLLCLTGCGGSAAKTTNLSVFYGVTMAISALLLLSYALFEKKRDVWLLLLLACVMVVNIGYFALSISQNLAEALLANRISYLGSVFLPLFMMMGILKESRLTCRRWILYLLLLLSMLVFLVAASPGYSSLYYKEVQLVFRNGVSILEKVYGPLHLLYPVYLIGYFAAMVLCIAHAIRKKLTTGLPAVMLAGMVLINIAVWLMEQFVSLEIELLSMSYILSELFLLSVRLLRRQNDTPQLPCEAPDLFTPVQELPQDCMKTDDAQLFEEALEKLTKTERVIFNYYMQNTSTKEVMAALNIKENTLKFHNKNIYGKFGVSSRKQLVLLHKKYLAAKNDS